MVKYLKIIAVMSFSLLSCQSISKVSDRLSKKVENFSSSDFPVIKFNRLFMMDGMYRTNENFELIQPKLEIHRGSDNEHSSDYLIINDNGTVDEFYAKDISSANLLMNKKSSSVYSGVIYKEKDKIIVEVMQAFKMGGGYGTYKKFLKIVGDKIYIQDGKNCSVYTLVE